MSSRPPSAAIPFAVACVGIALFSAMDAAMKGLAIAWGPIRRCCGGKQSAA
jgi:S-adenosylmethionine uptake transporter